MGEITEALRRARLERERRPEAPDAPPLGWVDLDELPEGGEAEAPPLEIPHSKQGEWRGRAILLNPPVAGVERLRHFALQVRRELESRGVRSLLVTSALRDEGKTVVACNLALALGSMAGGRRIALVDLDLRNPGVSSAMGGLTPEVGFERVLLSEVPLRAACVRTNLPALDLFLATRPQAHVHQLLAGATMETVFHELTRRYDTVVCDSPPTLLVPDAELIATHVGACLAVARAGKTRRSAFREMLGLLPREKLIGSFLNHARLPRRAQHYDEYYSDEGEPELS